MNRHARRSNAAQQTILVIFRREGMWWYPLELPHDADLAEHARLNPGTLRIEDARTGECLWRPTPDPQMRAAS